MAGFKCLKELTIVFARIDDDLFQNLISELPLLENLSLYFCLKLQRAIVSSHRLRKLFLHMAVGLLEALIDAPNLLSYSYSGCSLPYTFTIRASSLQEVKLILKPNIHINKFWFFNLREYLGRFKHHDSFALDLYLDPDIIIEFNLEDMRDCFAQVEPATVVKQMMIDKFDSALSYGDLLDGLFWCHHPETLTVPDSTGKNRDLVKILLEKMDEVPTCCHSSSIRCWRHYVKGEGKKSIKLKANEMVLQI